MEPLMSTPAEAAALLGVTRARVYRLIRDSELASVRIRRCRRLPVAAVLDYQSNLAAQSEDVPSAPTSPRRDPAPIRRESRPHASAGAVLP